MNEYLERKDSYLSFKLNEEIFAVNVSKVLEVLEMQKITKVPKTADYIRGVINFRGEILPVIDMRKKFNMELTEDNIKTVIIVFDLKIKDKQLVLGAIADGVKDVFDIKDTEIKDVPEMGSRYNIEFLYGMAKKDDKFIMIMDVDKVFSADALTLNSSDNSDNSK